MIVWRIRGEIIRTDIFSTVLCCVVYTVIRTRNEQSKSSAGVELRFRFCVFV